MNDTKLPDAQARIIGSMGCTSKMYNAKYVEELENLAYTTVEVAIENCGPCNSCVTGHVCSLKRLKKIIEESYRVNKKGGAK